MYNLSSISHPVVLFDGVCNLCSSSVQFIIKHDKKKLFRFASLHSPFGQAVMQQFGLPLNQLNSFILLQNNHIFTRSTGALKVARRLNGIISWLYVFIIVPPFIRNLVYSFIARNRYTWFGKKNACWLPTPALRELFWDDGPKQGQLSF
ncbi:MAG TPA: DCC1-like thiol-disulfide oxidoreductase family protein [Chitinophagaceae bacterium]|nr:DCC1-like thiol-disulfide oxidoreductase family protein [Chitinophagaceae bacterium]